VVVANTTADFFTSLPDKNRILGLDIGTKTIGLALSDVLTTIATPLETIKRTKFTADAARLWQIVDMHQAGGLVIGLPLNMNGDEGPKCQSVRQFARNLLKEKDIPILFHDERLSTVAAERTLLEADVSRQKRAVHIDKMAAAIILQAALNTKPAQPAYPPTS